MALRIKSTGGDRIAIEHSTNKETVFISIEDSYDQRAHIICLSNEQANRILNYLQKMLNKK